MEHAKFVPLAPSVLPQRQALWPALAAPSASAARLRAQRALLERLPRAEPPPALSALQGVSAPPQPALRVLQGATPLEGWQPVRFVPRGTIQLPRLQQHAQCALLAVNAQARVLHQLRALAKGNSAQLGL